MAVKVNQAVRKLGVNTDSLLIRYSNLNGTAECSEWLWHHQTSENLRNKYSFLESFSFLNSHAALSSSNKLHCLNKFLMHSIKLIIHKGEYLLKNKLPNTKISPDEWKCSVNIRWFHNGSVLVWSSSQGWFLYIEIVISFYKYNKFEYIWVSIKLKRKV